MPRMSCTVVLFKSSCSHRSALRRGKPRLPQSRCPPKRRILCEKAEFAPAAEGGVCSEKLLASSLFHLGSTVPLLAKPADSV